jgi:hypothetical protein
VIKNKQASIFLQLGVPIATSEHQFRFRMPRFFVSLDIDRRRNDTSAFGVVCYGYNMAFAVPLKLSVQFPQLRATRLKQYY